MFLPLSLKQHYEIGGVVYPILFVCSQVPDRGVITFTRKTDLEKSSNTETLPLRGPAVSTRSLFFPSKQWIETTTDIGGSRDDERHLECSHDVGGCNLHRLSTLMKSCSVSTQSVRRRLVSTFGEWPNLLNQSTVEFTQQLHAASQTATEMVGRRGLPTMEAPSGEMGSCNDGGPNTRAWPPPWEPIKSITRSLRASASSVPTFQVILLKHLAAIHARCITAAINTLTSNCYYPIAHDDSSIHGCRRHCCDSVPDHRTVRQPNVRRQANIYAH
jgi:hypothetical protein